MTRREALTAGASRLLFVAPVISTFCATRAHAAGSNPLHASSPLGPGGCKNVGFSCVINNDCCEEGIGKTACQTGTCCVQHNEAGCLDDIDCCNGGDSCVAGQCQ